MDSVAVRHVMAQLEAGVFVKAFDSVSKGFDAGASTAIESGFEMVLAKALESRNDR